MNPSRRDLARWLAGGGAATAVLGVAAAAPAGLPQGLSEAQSGTMLPPGLWRVNRDLTIQAGLALAPGARIEVAAGCVLTVLGSFSAPLEQVFVGGGRVDLNRAALIAACPEWWGARPGDGNHDCLPALRACAAAHPAMMLRAADYYIADTWHIDRPFLRVWGAGYRGAGAGEGTRILVRSGTADVVQVGADRHPGSVNSFLQGVDLRWMELGRTEPVDSRAGREPAGLRARFLLHCQFEGLSSRESGVGFAAVGVVRSYLRDCIAFRSIPGRSAGTFRGFWLGGLDQVGLAGANGSIFLNDCNVSVGGSPGVTDSVGLLLDGGFADSFVTRFEATSLETGIRIDGRAGEMGGAAVSGHANLHIVNAIVDQCGRSGIEIRHTSPYALIEISDPYVAVAAGADAAIAVRRAHGAMSVAGGQLIGRSDVGGRSAGLSLADSSGFTCQGLKIADFGVPVQIATCASLRLGGAIANPMRHAGRPAIALRGSSRVALTFSIDGRARAFTDAIAIEGADCRAVTVDASLVDRAALSGGVVSLEGRALRGAGRVGAVTLFPAI